jgi:uncharacterized protein YndB with AHSA1/START domain
MFEKFEFKSGGVWRFTMVGPDNANYQNVATFESIVPNSLVVVKHLSQPHFTLSIKLDPTATGTTVTWEQAFESPEVAASLRHIVEPANEQNLSRWQAEVMASYQFNPQLDLTFTRNIDVPKEMVWRAWTEPKLLMPWFCPLPWKTVDCEINLRPGGVFRTTMQSPEGVEFPNFGCYLEICHAKKLIWTNALLPGFRPVSIGLPVNDNQANFAFTAEIELEEIADGTRYAATVRHADEAGCKKHEAMGFEQGWGTALEQMIAMIQRGI